MFDDSVLDKSGNKKIKLARWQYSGTAHDTVMGVGVVNCVYYNPEIDRYWVIDAGIYQPDEDGKKEIRIFTRYDAKSNRERSDF